jgi:hypothetical protein
MTRDSALPFHIEQQFCAVDLFKMNSATVTLSREELQDMIDESVERKLVELLGDPDLSFELKPEVREQLQRSFESEERGERGISYSELIKRYRRKL